MKFTVSYQVYVLQIEIQRSCFIKICFGHFTENFDESYQLRGGVYFVDELPLTVSGKIIQRIARMHAEKEFNSRNKGST